MSEDLKRELEGLSEDVSENTEALIKDLIDESDKRPPCQSVPPVSNRWKSYLIYIGIFLILLSIVLGFFFLWNILKPPSSKEVSKVTEGVIKEDTKVKEETNKIDRETKESENIKEEKIAISKEEREKKYNYNLKLSNFLFPLDEKNFLKVDIYLYFASYEEYRRAQEREFVLRKFFYQELKKAEATLWKSERKVREFEEKLRELIIKGDIEVLPEKLELEGVILKT